MCKLRNEKRSLVTPTEQDGHKGPKCDWCVDHLLYTVYVLVKAVNL